MRLRLTLITTGIVVVVYAAFAGALFAAQMQSRFTNTDSDLRDAAGALTGQGGPPAPMPGPQRRGHGQGPRMRDEASRPSAVVFLGRDGQPRSDDRESGDVIEPDAATADLARSGAGARRWTDEVEGVPYRLYALGYSGGAVVVGTPVAAIVRQQARLGGLLLVGGILVAALVAAATALTAGWALRPVRRMRETAEAVAATEDPSLRIPATPRRDEVGRLARAFDTMLVRLRGAQERAHESLDSQRRFLADASHELRSPVTSLRGNLDILARHPEIDATERDQMIGEMRTEAARLGDLVEDVLDLTRVDGGGARTGAWVRPGDVAGAVAAATRKRADTEGRDVVVVDAAPGHNVWTDAEVLRRVLDSLVDNAVVHGSGRIEIRVHPPDAGVLQVQVSDEGPGVSDPDSERVFGRFARGPGSQGRAGSGLGLAIARALCDQIGATLARHGTDPAVFVVSLPAPAPAA